jgi:hypothetical protein
MSKSGQIYTFARVHAIGMVIGIVSGVVRLFMESFRFTQLQVHGGSYGLFYFNPTLESWLSFIVWCIWTWFVTCALVLFAWRSMSVWMGMFLGILFGGVWVCLFWPLFGLGVWPIRYEWRTIVVELSFFVVWGNWISMSIGYFIQQKQTVSERA